MQHEPVSQPTSKHRYSLLRGRLRHGLGNTELAVILGVVGLTVMVGISSIGGSVDSKLGETVTMVGNPAAYTSGEIHSGGSGGSNSGSNSGGSNSGGGDSSGGDSGSSGGGNSGGDSGSSGGSDSGGDSGGGSNSGGDSGSGSSGGGDSGSGGGGLCP